MDSQKRHDVNCRNEQPLSSGGTLQVTRPQVRYHHQRSPNNFRLFKAAKAFSNATVTWTLKYRRNDAGGHMDLIDSSVAAMERYI